VGMSPGLLAVLAEFFDVIGSQKAHWYRVLDTKNGHGKDLLIQSTFPSLSSLIKMESHFVHELFVEVGLVKTRLYRGVHIAYADHSAWDSFFHEYCLEMETTVFEPRNSKNTYVKIGKWSNVSHPPRTPGQIWKEAIKKGSYNLPKLRISSAAMKLARCIGKQFTTSTLSIASSKTTSKNDDNGSETSNDTSDGSIASNDTSDGSTASHDITKMDLPNLKEYPLFHSHGLNINDESIRNLAVHELLKNMGGNAILYRQKSHHKGALIRIPSASSAIGYSKLLKRKGNFMEQLLLFMNESAKGNEAAACLIQYLLDNYQEEFREVASKNNLMVRDDKKMEPSKVEAMLHEAGIGKSNSRVLFRHLSQFFGTSMFASEKVRRKCFSGEEFEPEVCVHELPDKTKINYWYKLPHVMMQHYTPNLFSREDFLDISGVDITVGGDHGKGKKRFQFL
jgi:hypothetical protein